MSILPDGALDALNAAAQERFAKTERAHELLEQIAAKLGNIEKQLAQLNHNLTRPSRASSYQRP
jgi:cob(I)alamin adenosyltransferase